MAVDSNRVPLAGSEPVHRPGATRQDVAPAEARCQVTVVLKPEPLPPDHPVAVKSRRQEEEGVHAPPLSLEELATLNAPSPQAVEEVVRFAGRHELAVVEVSALRHDVVLEATAERFCRAFGVLEQEYRDEQGAYAAHSGPLRVERTWLELVDGILGLDTLPHFSTHTLPVPETSSRVYEPRELAEHYEFPEIAGGPPGRIALLESRGGFDPSDVAAYLAVRGLPPVEARVVTISDGRGSRGANTPLDPGMLRLLRAQWNSGVPYAALKKVFGPVLAEATATLEVTMDLELVAALAPGAPVDVYFAPPTADGWRRALFAIAGAPYPGSAAAAGPPVVLSISWGAAESCWGSMKLGVLHDALECLRRRGVAVCCSSGDFGAHNMPENPPLSGPLRHVNFPASSPAVLACGGTSLVAGAGAMSDERAWKETLAGLALASGGGMSGYFPTPAYQTGLEVSVPTDTWLAEETGPEFRGRWLPDVAAYADFSPAIALRLAGEDFVGGGTSAATPIWAALIARLAAALGRPLGWPNPTLYRLTRGAGLRDITEGDSDLPTGGNGAGGWQAGPGWDPVTGLGSPRGRELLEALRRGHGRQ